jgi:hypothetical protein
MFHKKKGETIINENSNYKKIERIKSMVETEKVKKHLQPMPNYHKPLPLWHK